MCSQLNQVPFSEIMHIVLAESMISTPRIASGSSPGTNRIQSFESFGLGQF